MMHKSVFNGILSSDIWKHFFSLELCDLKNWKKKKTSESGTLS